MLKKQEIQSDRAPKAGGAYSVGVRAGHLVFVAGQGPFTVQGDIAGETIEEQTAATLENVKAILEAGGVAMADVCKTTVHLSDLSLFDRFNSVYAGYFPDPKPVRTTVGSSLLHDILIEIDVLAVSPEATN